jgi:hypothetical protein
LVPAVEFQPADETREGTLCSQQRLCSILPLSLPEWRAEHSTGSLATTDGGLRFTYRRQGQRLFAALFFDLAPHRFNRQLTWRQLSIAEKLQTLDEDVAAGYRVQIGKWQWLIYRSLAPLGNRTILGQNFSTEFVLARFDTEGEAEKLIEIE